TTRSRNCYCSVPQCSNNKKNIPYLRFHDFPADAETRAQWETAIGRDEGPNFKILHGSTSVCSQHFSSEETYVSASGRKKLKKKAVPSKYPWNDWGKGKMTVFKLVINY
uniref:THAP domain-containing protein 1 n=1 Tax=Fundulus heteroclitus TaxID=8078 RepID=A0A3Q2NMQ1_FUNHE